MRNNYVHFGGKETPKALFTLLNFGWSGVDLFFVLSGFLIGKMLFQEWKDTGRVKMGIFILRRGFRIWPLYYSVCLASLISMYILGHAPEASELIPDLLFLTNYMPELLVPGGWSLSVEEQFYLVASATMLISRKKKLTDPFFRIFWVLISLLLTAPLIRYFTWKYYAGEGADLFHLEWEQIHSYLHTHYDGLVVGLIIAALVVFRHEDTRLKKWVTPVVLGAILATSLLAASVHKIGFLYSAVALLYGLIVWDTLNRPLSFFARILSCKLFQVISRLSFGMYLWYRFPLWKVAKLVMEEFLAQHPAVQVLMIFLITMFIAMLTATITFVFIERYFLGLRKRYLHPEHAAGSDSPLTPT